MTNNMFTIEKITPQNKFQQFKQKWNSIPKKIRINLIVLTLLILVIPVSITAVLNQVRIRSNASINPSGTVTLAISPSSSSLAPNTTTTLSISINTNESKVLAVQAELTYSTDTCITPSITQGSFLTNVLSSPKVENGTIKFTFAAPPDSGGIQGSGTLATIQTGPTTGTCQLSFTQNTAVVVMEVAGNALASASDAIITLTTASPNPSPSPSSSPNPSSSPSPSPNTSPSASPSPSPRPSASPLSYKPPTPSPSQSPITIASPYPDYQTNADTLTATPEEKRSIFDIIIEFFARILGVELQ
ncbi:MAG: cohesin domain-containing protein [Patescibacteria group bacterium]